MTYIFYIHTHLYISIHTYTHIHMYIVEKKRDVEIDLVPAADMIINFDQGVTTSTLPKSLRLLQSVDVSNLCWSVCKYEDNTYVGLYGGAGIDRIDESFSVSKSFISLTNYIFGVTVHRNKLYAVECISKTNWVVHVYDLTGKQVTSWSHHDNSVYVNKLAIVDDQVVVPDRRSKWLTIYSLTGEVIKHVSCPLLSDSNTTICAVDRYCVVVSDYGSSQVFKLDLTTEKVIWTCKDVRLPEGVTCYRSKYILVTNSSSKTTIWILDVETG